MNYITHSMGGVTAGLLAISAGNIVDPAQQVTVVTGATLGALFIDIDHRQSWAGHKFPILAEVMSSLFKHRGPIHTPVFIIGIALLLQLANWGWLASMTYLAPLFISGFIPGMFSHIILDTLNVQGIMWLWPISKKRLHLLPIRTNSMFEGVVCIVMAACIYKNLL